MTPWGCVCDLGAPVWGLVLVCMRPELHSCPSAHEPSVLTRPFASLPGPVMVSLRPCSELLNPQPLLPETPPSVSMAPSKQTDKVVVDNGRRAFSRLEEKVPRQGAAEHRLEEKTPRLTNGFDMECPPPKTENEVGTRRAVRALGWSGESER